jgi:hypothetical protein
MVNYHIIAKKTLPMACRSEIGFALLSATGLKQNK